MRILPKISLITLIFFCIINLDYCPTNEVARSSSTMITENFPVLSQLYETCGMIINDPKSLNLERCFAKEIIQSMDNIGVEKKVQSNCSLFLVTSLLETSPASNLFSILSGDSSNIKFKQHGKSLISFAEVTSEKIVKILVDMVNQGLIPGNNLYIEFPLNSSRAIMRLLVELDHDKALGCIYLKLLQEFIPNFSSSIQIPNTIQSIKIEALINYLSKSPIQRMFNQYQYLLKGLDSLAKDIPEMKMSNYPRLGNLFLIEFDVENDIVSQFNRYCEHINRKLDELRDLEKTINSIKQESYIAPERKQELDELEQNFEIGNEYCQKCSERYKKYQTIYAKEFNSEPKRFHELIHDLFEHLKQTNSLEKKNIKDPKWLQGYLTNMTPGIFGVYLAKCGENSDDSNSALYLSNNSTGKLSWTSTKLTVDDRNALVPLDISNIYSISNISKPLLFKQGMIYSILNSETGKVQFYYKPYEPQKTLPVASTSASSSSTSASSSTQNPDNPPLADFQKIGDQASNANKLIIPRSIGPIWKIVLDEKAKLVLKQDKIKGVDAIVSYFDAFLNKKNVDCIRLDGERVAQFVDAILKAVPSHIASFSNLTQAPQCRFAYFLKVIKDDNKIHVRMMLPGGQIIP